MSHRLFWSFRDTNTSFFIPASFLERYLDFLIGHFRLLKDVDIFFLFSFVICFLFMENITHHTCAVCLPLPPVFLPLLFSASQRYLRSQISGCIFVKCNPDVDCNEFDYIRFWSHIASVHIKMVFL